MNYVSKNKFYPNSPQPKQKPIAIHDYYKSYEQSQSDPAKLLKSNAQLKLKGFDNQSSPITNNSALSKNQMQNMNSKFTIKTKPVSNQPQPINTENLRKNSKRNDNIGSKEDLKKKSSRTNFSYDPVPKKSEQSNPNSALLEMKKSKTDFKLPKIDSEKQPIKPPPGQFFSPELVKKENLNGYSSPKIDYKQYSESKVEEVSDPSPVFTNRNQRIVPRNNLLVSQQVQPDSEAPVQINIKTQKRLSDVGMHAEELKNLVARFNASEESKKESKIDAGSVLTIGGKKKEKEESRREESGSHKEESLGKKEDSNVLKRVESGKATPAQVNSQNKTFEIVSPLKPAFTRTVTNFAFKSKAGAMPGNVTKTNQDVYIAVPSMFGSRERSFFSVCDGHGVNGHFVSGYIKQNLPKFFERVYHEQSDNDAPERIKNALHEAHLMTFHGLIDTSIDSNFSGSTSVSVFINESKIYCANVGDSRAIIARCKNSQWSALPLSRDQKPDDPMEMQRVLKCGGRVEAFKDFLGNPVGPSRVWLKNENIPGLAMARSIGDRIASQVGVIPDPEIKEFDVSEDDRFIVIASDGVWEFLSNVQVMNYVLPFYLKNQPEAACEKLIKESVICWKREDEVIDDITAIVIFFGQKA